MSFQIETDPLDKLNFLFMEEFAYDDKSSDCDWNYVGILIITYMQIAKPASSWGGNI